MSDQNIIALLAAHPHERCGGTGRVEVPTDRIDLVEPCDCAETPTPGLDPWFVGPLGFVLSDPVAYEEPIPFRGALPVVPPADTGPRRLRAAVHARTLRLDGPVRRGLQGRARYSVRCTAGACVRAIRPSTS